MRTLVIGVGNLLLRDEGIGIHVVQALQKMALPDNVTVIDGGLSPHLVEIVEAGDRVIVVDAARGKGEPGTIYRLYPNDLDSTTSFAHDIGIEQALKIMALTGNQPSEIVIIGVEPAEIDWGTELSEKLWGKLPAIIKAVLAEVGIAPH